MTARPNTPETGPTLIGSEGELVLIRISIEPRMLERALDTLARLDFPINPEIRHAAGPITAIEFPAWSARIPQVRDAILGAGFDRAVVAVRSMLDEIRSEPHIAVRATA
jgi:hypothetical protein